MTVVALRTTAILKTDLARSTPRFRALSQGDLSAFLSDHRALLTRVAAAHDGRIVKPEGDGYWLAFPSVTVAALAAMSMQEELRLSQPNAGDDRLTMRVVITVGDVLFQEGGLVGDAVVLATRIEAMTPPDEIYVSEAAWLTMNRAEIRTSRVESFTVKGFAEPVAVHRIEQTHRTRVIADQYIVVTDLKRFSIETRPLAVIELLLDGLLDAVTNACREFGGVVRFSAGDGYCLTFAEAAGAMAATEQLVKAWDAFVHDTGIDCPMNVAVHKGTLYAFRSYLHGRDLNVAFRVESVAHHRLPEGGGIFVTQHVVRDLISTSWEVRLEAVPLQPVPAGLKDTEIFRLRAG